MRISLPQTSWLPEETSALEVSLPSTSHHLRQLFSLLPLIFWFWIGFWWVENYRAVPGFSLSNYRDIFSQFFTRSRYVFAIAQSLWVASTTTV